MVPVREIEHTYNSFLNSASRQTLYPRLYLGPRKKTPNSNRGELSTPEIPTCKPETGMAKFIKYPVKSCWILLHALSSAGLED